MRLLALDTSSIACSVALGTDDGVFERHEIKPREHTRLLIPMIEGVLKDAGAGVSDLEAIVLGNGPGSFIGMRIAASVAQGLSYGADLKIIPVSSLAAVAAESLSVSAADCVLVAQDAHMSEVYLACFSRGEDGLPFALGEPMLQRIERIPQLDRCDERGLASCYAAGAGWQRYPDLLRLNDDRLDGVIDVPLPRARFLLDLGRKSWGLGGGIDPELLIPAYVRTQVAAETRA